MKSFCRKISEARYRVIIFFLAMMICFAGLVYAEPNKGGGVVGTSFDFIGEVIAFPFQILADVFRFIF